MSRSAEKILLEVGHVKHKKNEGSLVVMGERIAWMMSSRSDTFAINLKYTEIKTQKISPDGKAKIQLQIVQHDGNSTTFHFVNPSGQAAQIKDRERVKDLLQQLLPKFKRKVNKELEEKNKMLRENPGLLQLYKDLVLTQILAAEEFWAQHAPEMSAKAKSKLGQEVGVSGSFLSDIKPQADGANGIKYNLTADIIDSIFKTYPAVKRKHAENVPSKMTEQDFWIKFFQSHYFHRDRLLHSSKTGGAKDIFTECAKDDDNTIKAQIRAGVADPLANLDNFSDKTLDECYGASDSSAGIPDSGRQLHGSNVVHQNIIKRFNQHSIMVMCASNSSSIPTPAQTTTPQQQEEAQSELKKKRLREQTDYDDLNEEPPKKVTALKLAKGERYLTGPTPASSLTSSSDTDSPYLTPDEVRRWRTSLGEELVSRDEYTRAGPVLSARNAVSVLNDLSPGGALMQAARQESLAEHYPETVQRDLRQLYGSLSELLRHFWGCFVPTPPTTPALQEKAAKTFDTLNKFQHVKLRPFENDLARNYSSGPKITNHINQMLEAATRKFSTWQQKVSKLR